MPGFLGVHRLEVEMKKLLMQLLVFFVYLTFCSDCFAADSKLKIVKIGAFNFYPAIFQAKDGSVQGFYVDFLKEIAKREGWQIEYVYGSWAEGLSRIKSGEVDVLTNVAFTAERAAYLDYGKEPLLTVWAELYVPSKSDIDSIIKVKEKKIAVMKGDFNAANFKNLVAKFKIPCEIIEFGDFEEVFAAVSSLKVDGGIVNNTFGAAKQHEYDIKSSGVIFNPFDIFFAVSKDKNRNIITALDHYLTEWRKEESSPYHQAREKWAHGSASTIKVIPAWLSRSLALLIISSGVAVVFILLLRIQVKRKTSDLKTETDEHIKTVKELHLTTEQLEEELAERLSIQETLQEQTVLLEEEVDDHMRTEVELQVISQRLQLAVSSTKMGVWDWNVKDNIMVWNDRMFELYGITRETFPACIDAWLNGLHPDDSQRAQSECQAALKGESVYNTEFRVTHPDGTIKHLKADAIVQMGAGGTAIRMIGVNSDITGRKHLEEQLRQSQKMDAIGQLAGGVAHDFNNILTVILGYCSLLKVEDNLDPDQKDAVEQVIASSEKAARLTKGLLAFSRKQVLDIRINDLNDIVKHVETFLVRIIGEDIQFKSIYHGNKLPVNVDSSQIEQVLINLATNARDAMTTGGMLTVETGFQKLDETFKHAHGYAESGLYAFIAVSDNGIGMDEQTCARLFEPFFTTKEVGKGTGLGMAIVYGIVQQHKGIINIYSEPGTGTVFRIYLHLVETEQAEHLREMFPSEPQGGTETIMVAEDDISVRKLVTTLLTKFGYEVIQAVDGQEAVEKFAENCDRISLILMDMIMPKKNGKEAYEEINRISPGVKVLYSSGYTADFIQNRGVSEAGIELIMKPVKPVELLLKIRAILDR